MIASLWRFFFAVCCFRKGPQDLPAAKELMMLSLLAYCLASFLLALTTQTQAIALASGLLDGVLLAALSYVFLCLRGKPERWLQTTTALSGSGFIFNLAGCPLFYWAAANSGGYSISPILFLLIISLLVWNIAVMAHIMRHAMSTSLVIGVIVALFYVWLITTSISNLFPVSQGL